MTPSRRWFALLALSVTLSAPALAEDVKTGAKKHVLLVTHSGGFLHDSVGVAEDTLKKLAPANNLLVTCYRFTGDPEARVKVRDKKDGPERETSALEAYSAKYREKTGKSVEAENCGRINKETLKNFDAVIFFTTGDPVTKDELADLLEWVKAGGAFAGTHCGADTLYGQTAYGDLVGAYFRTHPPGLQKVTVKVEDPKHPAAKAFAEGEVYEDEIYIFKDAPYSRDKLHIILSADGFMPTNGKQDIARKDGDYALSWCKESGKGKVFYTAFGHQKEVWEDAKFQAHFLGGLKWAMGQVPGDATPTGAPK